MGKNPADGKSATDSLFTSNLSATAPGSAKRTVPKIPEHGDRGDHILTLKAALNSRGANLSATKNFFGDDTTKAIAAFQKLQGFAGTGVIGPKTMAALGLSVAKPEAPKPTAPVEVRSAQHWKSLVRAGVELHPVFKVPAPYTHLHPIDFLRAFAGIKEVSGDKDNILIAHFHEHAGNLGTHTDSKNDFHDETPHCASAQNWAQDGCGCEKSNHALASSYESYAKKFNSRSYKKGDTIPEGAIICLNGHVTRANKSFKWTGTGSFEGFGSNQGNSIKTSSYPQSRIRTICEDKPKAGTRLAPIGILGHKPTPATGGSDESTR